MAAVVVKVMGDLRESLAGGSIEFPMEPGASPTLGDLLRWITRNCPDLAERLFEAEGRVAAHIHIFVNRHELRQLPQGLDTPLTADDRILITPPLVGG